MRRWGFGEMAEPMNEISALMKGTPRSSLGPLMSCKDTANGLTDSKSASTLILDCPAFQNCEK